MNNRDNANIPKWPMRLLKRLIKPTYLEEIEGDMEEEFRDNLELHSRKKAVSQYYWDCIKLLRPAILRNTEGTYRLNSYGMIKNYLKTARRNLIKSPLFTSINVLGLALGIACSIHLASYVLDEFSYDNFFSDSEHIYRVALNRSYSDYQEVGKNVPHSFAEVAAEDYPEIEQATSIAGPFGNMLLWPKLSDVDKTKYYESVVAADSNFFSFFDFKMIKGNPLTALKRPKSMVLTQSTAIKFFGNTNVLGKTINMSGDDFEITGICEDLPENTHLKFNVLMSIHTIRRFNIQNFSRPDVKCYFKLIPGTDYKKLESSLTQMVSKYSAPEIEKSHGTSWADYVKAGNGFQYFLVPLTSLYLHQENLGGLKPGGNITAVRIIIVVALFTFILVFINYINLTTARSLERAKEIGIRKVMGSLKKQLVFQFLVESIILNMAGMLMAIMVVIFTQSHFNSITGKMLSFHFSAPVLAILAALAIFNGILAGLYPAFVMSSFKPIVFLKGKFSTNTGSRNFRDGLVIFQFSISIAFLIGVFVVNDQIKYLLNKDLGFNKEQLLVVTGYFHKEPAFANTFVNELRAMPQVKLAAGSLSVPSLGVFWEEEYQKENVSDLLTARTMIVGDNFLETFGLRLKNGNSFSADTWDSLSVILNESAVDALSLANPVGEKILHVDEDGLKSYFTIIGVVQDFNFDYLYNTVTPLVIKSNEFVNRKAGKIIARLQTSSHYEAISEIEATWKKLRPDEPFTYRFVDDMVDSYYKKEQRLLEVFKVFTALSIFIAVIGLFALSAYSTRLRTKEIGIRKVLGAPTLEILYQLVKRYAFMILIASVIGTPIAVYTLQNWWLRDFAYRVEISVWSIILASMSMTVLALLTIIYQTVKTSQTNPVEVLSEE